MEKIAINTKLSMKEVRARMEKMKNENTHKYNGCIWEYNAKCTESNDKNALMHFAVFVHCLKSSPEESRSKRTI